MSDAQWYPCLRSPETFIKLLSWNEIYSVRFLFLSLRHNSTSLFNGETFQIKKFLRLSTGLKGTIRILLLRGLYLETR